MLHLQCVLLLEMYLITLYNVISFDFKYLNAKELIREHLLEEIMEKMSEYHGAEGEGDDKSVSVSIDDGRNNIPIYTVSAKNYLQLIGLGSRNSITSLMFYDILKLKNNII